MYTDKIGNPKERIRKIKRLGQHFLVDGRVLEREAEVVRCTGKVVLEIGPGDGRLSEKLMAYNPTRIYLVEKDKRFANLLEEKFARHKNVFVIADDFLRLEPFTVDVVVGNLPYYVSSAITFRLLDWSFSRAVLMYQKEFADKMCAEGKDKSRLSFFVQYYYDVKKLFTVSRFAFSPVPKVDSTLVELIPREEVKRIDEETHNLITSLFQHRLKTLNASLKLLCKEGMVSEKTYQAVCAKFDCNKRIFELSNDDILAICRELRKSSLSGN